MSVQENLYPRCILGHKVGGFIASQGLPNKHEFLKEFYHYANYGNQILVAIVHCPEKSNTLKFRDRKIFGLKNISVCKALY